MSGAIGFPLEDPIRLRELIERGAHAVQRGAPGPDKQLGKAIKRDRSTANRHKRGSRTSPPTHYLEALSEGEATNAIPLAAEGLALVYERQVGEANTYELEERIRVLIDREHDIDRDLRREVLRFAESGKESDDHERIAELRMLKVECGLESAGIHRELAKRLRRIARAAGGKR